MPNPFIHVELLTGDTPGARAFYEKLFGWCYREASLGDVPHLVIDVGEGTGGDISAPLAGGQTPMWLPYVRVDDLDQTLVAVRANGGVVRKDRTEEVGMGAYAVIVDPAGAMLGIWQPPSVWPTEFFAPKVTDMFPDASTGAVEGDRPIQSKGDN